MTELDLSKDPLPQSEGDRTLKIVLGLLVLGSALVALAAVLGFSTWKDYSSRFSEVDHSADSIATSTSQAVPLKGAPTSSYRIDSETVYKNTKSGVTLRLPGIWKMISAPQITRPDAAHRFCVLHSQDDSTLMFWPLFPVLLPSLDAYAEVVRGHAAGGLVERGQRDLVIRGKKAKELEFFMPSSGLNVNLVVIRRGLVVYVLAVTGSREVQSPWKRFEDALPEAIDIQ